MKNTWQLKKLADICIFEKKPNSKGGLPYVGLEDIESNTGKFIGSKNPQKVKSFTFNFTSDHVLYGRLRPYLNKVLLPDFEGHCSTEIFPIQPKSSLDKRFLFHWLLSNETVKKINSTCTGARMPRANMNLFLELDILVPPFYEQQRIVAILDKAFAAITTAKENVEKNLQNVHKLFQSRLQSVFTSWDGRWKEKKLGEVYDVRDGTHDSPKFQKSGFALITSKNLKKGTLNYDRIQYISEDDYEKINQRSKVHKGDLLFAMIGTIGNPIVIDVDPNFAIKNVALFKIPKDQSSYFLKYYLDTKYVINKMMREANGTTQKFVGLGYLRNFKIMLPPFPVQCSIVAKLDILSAEIKKLEAIYQQKLKSLEELKKSLLQKAFNGELT